MKLFNEGKKNKRFAFWCALMALFVAQYHPASQDVFDKILEVVEAFIMYTIAIKMIQMYIEEARKENSD